MAPSGIHIQDPSSAKRNYKIHDKELLSIIEAWKSGDIFWKEPNTP